MLINFDGYFKTEFYEQNSCSLNFSNEIGKLKIFIDKSLVIIYFFLFALPCFHGLVNIIIIIIKYFSPARRLFG